MFRAPAPTASVGRFREHGWAGLTDRSSRPRSCPYATTPETVRAVISARTEHRESAADLAVRCGVPERTVSRIIERPSEYADREKAVVAATQNDDLTATQQRKVLKEWMEFFAPSVPTLEPLASNGTMRTLKIEGLRDAHDMSPPAALECPP